MSIFRYHIFFYGFLLILFGCTTSSKTPPASQSRPEATVNAKPEDPATLYKRGNALFDAGNYIEAQAAYEKVVQHNPKHQSAHANLALALKRQGLMEQALKEYRIALDLDPKDAVTRENLVIALEEGGQAEEALKILQTASEQEPKNTEYLRHLGAILRNLNRYNEAATAFEKVLQLEPDKADDYYDLGLCYFCEEDWDRTLTTWLTAIAHDPKHVAANKGLAVAYWKRGDYAKAWDAVSHCGALGIIMDAQFIKELEKTQKNKTP